MEEPERKGWAIIQVSTHLSLLAGWRTLANPWLSINQTTFEAGRPNSLAVFSSIEEAQAAARQLGPAVVPEEAQIIDVVDNRPPEERNQPTANPMAS